MQPSARNQRAELLNQMVAQINRWPFAIACWEGGSAANARLDAYSDIDLILCVEDGEIETAFKSLDNCLDGIVQISKKWRVQEPTPKGYSQCCYQLDGWPSYSFLDCVVINRSMVPALMEKERHGIPVLHFDREQIVKVTSANTPGFSALLERRISAISDAYVFYYALVRKEIFRGHALDALQFYRQLVSFYVELIRIQYVPFQFDFGLRYLQSSVPLSTYEQIRRFSFVNSLEELSEYLPLIVTEIEKEIRNAGQSRPVEGGV